MTKGNALVFCVLLLIGCQDFAFDGFGNKLPQTPNNNSSVPALAPNGKGEVVSCVTDEQCGDQLVCYKKNPVDEYVGVCAQLR